MNVNFFSLQTIHDAIGGNFMGIEAKKGNELSEENLSGASGGWVGVRMKKPLIGKAYKVYEVFDDNSGEMVDDFKGKDAALNAKLSNLKHNSQYYSLDKPSTIFKKGRDWGLLH